MDGSQTELTHIVALRAVLGLLTESYIACLPSKESCSKSVHPQIPCSSATTTPWANDWSQWCCRRHVNFLATSSERCGGSIIYELVVWIYVISVTPSIVQLRLLFVRPSACCTSSVLYLIHNGRCLANNRVKQIVPCWSALSKYMSDFIMPRLRKDFGKRVFSHAGPRLNHLPVNLYVYLLNTASAWNKNTWRPISLLQLLTWSWCLILNDCNALRFVLQNLYFVVNCDYIRCRIRIGS